MLVQDTLLDFGWERQGDSWIQESGVQGKGPGWSYKFENHQDVNGI